MNAPDWSVEPLLCPFCGGNKVVFVNTWVANSGDLCDKDNVAELDEYQCEGSCEGRSFWV